ncbi:MAG: hypothetical protein CVV47_08520 [Spirochaetae bacterium HGW-Spirochaetae-3]|jgi:hypothetical protein|nr:MAG: hypothetical protein CVV47_08520 [Spirochaetae bacterium HGW-Spirochaetae-3]
MNETQTLKTLQLFYAGALVDAARQYEAHGVLEQVTEAKRREQEAAAPGQLLRLGITTPEALFATFSAIFGCAAWTTETEGRTFRAKTGSCLACAIAKKLGAPAPCSISCINPFAGLAGALPEPRRLEVRETLWDGDECVFELTP